MKAMLPWERVVCQARENEIRNMLGGGLPRRGVACGRLQRWRADTRPAGLFPRPRPALWGPWATLGARALAAL